MGSKIATQCKPPVDLYIVMDYKYCRVWVRKIDKFQHLEQYPLQLQNQEQLESYRKMFFMRMEQQYFPNTMYFMAGPTMPLCTNLKTGSILIQRIPYRLCQFTNILYSEAISMLNICFKGYQILNENYGLFKVKSTMIGLDQSYRIKMWHHTDLSSSIPEDPYCHTVCEMIECIIRSIENVSACPYNMPRFSQFLEINKVILFGFEIAIREIARYATQYEIKLSQKFPSIEKYLKEAQGVSPLSRKIFNSRSSDKFEASQSSRGKNKSLNKFSFKSNQVIQMQSSKLLDYVQTQQTHRIYPNYESHMSHSKDQHILMPIPTTPPLTKINSPRFQSPHTRLQKQQSRKIYIKKQTNADFDDYGFVSPQNYTPRINNHGRAASKNEQMTKQKQKIQAQHGRAASDFVRVNKQIFSKPYSPYIENTETREGESSTSRSFKTLISAESYSFVADDDNRFEMVNMLRQKNLK